MITGGKEFIVSTDEKWYKKYTGFPYAHLGDNINSGIDCFNLIKYVYKIELNIEIPYDTAVVIEEFQEQIDDAKETILDNNFSNCPISNSAVDLLICHSFITAPTSLSLLQAPIFASWSWFVTMISSPGLMIFFKEMARISLKSI